MTLSRHIDEEGIRHRARRCFIVAGRRDEELLNKILKAVRTADERLGDLDAQLAANHVGSASLCRMIERHGGRNRWHYGLAGACSIIRSGSWPLRLPRYRMGNIGLRM